jgi:hypothetical protein
MTEEMSQNDESSPVNQTDLLVELQEENDELRCRIDELNHAADQARSVQADLAKARQENDRLKRRHGQVALAEALRTTAEELGVSHEAVGTYAGQFTCTVDDDGEVAIEPDPRSLIQQKISGDPVLRASARRVMDVQLVESAVEGQSTDAVDTLSALDRNPGAKASFIARRGSEAYLKLCQAARVKGYRGWFNG